MQLMAIRQYRYNVFFPSFRKVLRIVVLYIILNPKELEEVQISLIKVPSEYIHLDVQQALHSPHVKSYLTIFAADLLLLYSLSRKLHLHQPMYSNQDFGVIHSSFFLLPYVSNCHIWFGFVFCFFPFSNLFSLLQPKQFV